MILATIAETIIVQESFLGFPSFTTAYNMPQESQEKVSFNIKTVEGQSYQVEVDPNNDTMDSIKRQVCRLAGVTGSVTLLSTGDSTSNETNPLPEFLFDQFERERMYTSLNSAPFLPLVLLSFLLLFLTLVKTLVRQYTFVVASQIVRGTLETLPSPQFPFVPVMYNIGALVQVTCTKDVMQLTFENIDE
eukprot:g52423.t1